MNGAAKLTLYCRKHVKTQHQTLKDTYFNIKIVKHNEIHCKEHRKIERSIINCEENFQFILVIP